MCTCLQCPQLSELVFVCVCGGGRGGELSVTVYILHRHRLCLVDQVDLTCSSTAGGKVWVFFLSRTAPEFQLWFYFHLCMWVVRPLGFAPEAALEDLGLPLGGPGVEVVQLLGLQGFWQHQVLRRVGS